MSAPWCTNSKVGNAQSYPQSVGSYTHTTVVQNSIVDSMILYEAAYFFSGTDHSISGVTWNGAQNLTFLFKINLPLGGGGSRSVEVWYLLNPTDATGNVTATWAGGNPNEAVSMAASFQNVLQSNPLYLSGGTVPFSNSADNTSTAPNVTVTGATTEMLIVDGVCSDEFPGILTPTGQQLVYDHSGGNGTAGGMQTKSGSGSINMNWSLVHTGQAWAMVAMGINGPTIPVGLLAGIAASKL